MFVLKAQTELKVSGLSCSHLSQGQRQPGDTRMHYYWIYCSTFVGKALSVSWSVVPLSLDPCREAMWDSF